MSTTLISKAAEFQLVVKQGMKQFDQSGDFSWSDPKILEFHRGVFIVNDEVAKDLGFESEQDLVTAIRRRKTFNHEFWEMGNEPDAQHPKEDLLLGKISDYAVDHNVEGLREILAQEQATHDRHSVVVAAQRALGRLGDTERGKRGPGRIPKAA